jgi:hypothetical protein
MAQARNDASNELGSLGKKLFSSIALWLSGKEIENLQLKGTDSQLDAIRAAMVASKDFQDELSKSDASLESISKKLEAKLQAAKTFEKELGVSWPL